MRGEPDEGRTARGRFAVLGGEGVAKRFFWLKLKEDYFDSPRIKKLRKIAGGDTYTVIYLKMQLLSIKNQGVIEYEGIEPTFCEELALKLNEEAENVEVTLSYLASQGLIEESGSGTYLLPEALKSIGSENESAERVRAFRSQKALQCNDGVTASNAPQTPCNTEIEKEIEIEKEREREEGQSAPAVFGKYQNVFLTDSELAELKEEIPEKWEYYIDRLSGYIASTGKKYQNHAATILRWAADDTAKAAPKQGIPDYTYKEGESL